MSRELMSLPIVYPVIFPFADITSVSSGSGTFHFESLRIRTFAPVPTARYPGDLKNNSGRSAAYTRS